MSYSDYEWLKKYEVKAPDYDFADRENAGTETINYDSLRFYNNDNVWAQRNKSSQDKAKLIFAGDITCFERQIEEAKVGENSYDFGYAFEPVSDIFKQADFVCGNFETMVSQSSPYRTEMYVSEQDFHCNAPVNLLEALRSCGFDMLTNANNHDLDTGVIGLGETIDNIERYGFIHTGTFKTDKRRFELIDINGFRVAIVAFGTDHNGKGVNVTEEGAEFLLNDYSMEKAMHIENEARNAGAEIVICCMHWGKENRSEPHKLQYQYAREFAQAGYDCIIGSHSHVLQPFDIIHEGNKDLPVFYCMGNFISHNVDNVKSRAILACIDLARDNNGKAVLTCSYIPVFTSENYKGGKYVVLPIPSEPQDSGNQKKAEMIHEDLGNKIQIDSGILFEEYIETPVVHDTAKKDPRPKLRRFRRYPIRYNGGRFIYRIYRDHAVLESITEGRQQISYTNARKVLGLPVTEIDEGAFENHPVIKKFKFMENITVIPARVCKGCKQLEGFRIDVKTKVIGEEAFADCPKMLTGVLRRGITRIERRAFANCTSMRSIKIPPEVTSIADDAFEGCEKIVFYCEEHSYAEEYARNHNIPVVYMSGLN